MSLRHNSYITGFLEMKFTTEQYNLICQTRDEIRALNERQHTLYNNLLKELNISI